MYEEKYLVFVSENNNNKFYHMKRNGNTFTATWGRVGTAGQCKSYPISQWDKKLQEKLAKGYTDQSDLHRVVEVKKETEYKKLDNEGMQEVMDFLMSCAQKTIQANYKISGKDVTPAMVTAARHQLNRIAAEINKTGNIHKINELLLELFSIIPRKMGKVQDYLAPPNTDLKKLYQRESDLLDVMSGQVVSTVVDDSHCSTTSNQTILENLGLKMRDITKEEEEKIKKLLGTESGLFSRAWAITNHTTQKKFDSFLENHRKPSGRRMTRKLLWHGSRNENWISILKTGLVLIQDAKITGKMFGCGIYFAQKAKKSIGYTSLSGSYWVGGNSNRAYMALFDVAYGTPYHTDNNHSISPDFKWRDLQRILPGASCLHAHARKQLRNDEIIFYREDQVTVKYLVELKR